jgi:4-hydroxy-2-oxoglutarate aldolase
MSGAGGGILAAANVIPNLFTALRSHVLNGRIAEALTLQQSVTHFARLVTTVHSVAGLKAAMDMSGYRGGVPRAPMAPASAAAAAEIRSALDQLSSHLA